MRLAYYYNFTNQAPKALSLLEQAKKKHPRNIALKLQEVFLTPIVYQSAEEIDWWHKHLSEQLSELEQWLSEPETLTNGPIYTFSPIFNLMPMGRNDRELLERISNVWKRIFVPPSLPLQPLSPNQTPNKTKIKLGIISGTVYDHSTMHYFQGMLYQIANTPQIESALFYSGKIQDDVTHQIRSLVDHFQEIPTQLIEAANIIRSWQADVIFYLDIGMDSFLYTLAHIRKAAVQCVSAGIPMTTGIKTIDYYISSKWFEPETLAERNYSETLICLNEFMVNMHPPLVNNPLKTRAQLGLPKDNHVYFFPHSLIRVDPELDDLFAQILQQDPAGIILLIKESKKNLHTTILKRFKEKYPIEANRIQFLPLMKQPDYLNVLACSNVALDSLRLGGGNVTFQSFYVGTPMIQRPTELLRCRIATGLYKRLNMEEWIAQDQEDYVRKALILGTNATIRQNVSNKILAGKNKLFNQTTGVEQIINLFKAWGGLQHHNEIPSLKLKAQEEYNS